MRKKMMTRVCLAASVLLAAAYLILVIDAAWAQVPFTAHHTWIIVNAVSNVVRPALTARRYLALINDSSNVVYCSVDGEAAALNEGIRLAAAGTTGDRVFFDREVPQGQVNCISATINNRVLVIEGR